MKQTHWRRVGGGLLLGSVCLAGVSACTSAGHTAPNSRATRGSQPASGALTAGAPTAQSSTVWSSSASAAEPSATPSGRPSSAAGGGFVPGLPGAEGATSAAASQCKIIEASGVAAAFGGGVSSQVGRTSGTGGQICTFTLRKPSVSVVRAVDLAVNENVSRGAFEAARKSTPGAQAVALGDLAFYNPHSATLQALKGSTVVVVQAESAAPPSTAQLADQLRSQVTALGKAVLERQ
jgi:hypothetical protein